MMFPLVLIGCWVVGGTIGVLFAKWELRNLDQDTDDWINRRGKHS